MNDNNLKYVEKREKSDIFKTTKWKEIKWKNAEEYVNRLQIRIVKAKLNNKKNLVKRLQYLLVNSFYAKARENAYRKTAVYELRYNNL